MCLQYMKIKGVNYAAPNYQYVPCGKCAECRDMLRSGWSFRLRAEMQQKCYKDGWHAGFITLTYDDEHLPTLPQSLFRSYDEDKQIITDGNIEVDCYGEELHAETYEVVQCFDKEDIRQLVHGMRKFLWKSFGFRGLVYAIAGEYGTNTKRPHYHGLFAWPPTIPDSVIYGLISDYWRGTSLVVNDEKQKQFKNFIPRPDRGFICPRTLDGYKDEKPFVVSDPLAAANYASKYLVKDVGFANYLNDYDIDFARKDLKRYNCFHCQSRSLGVSILNGLTDDEKYKLFSDGFGFLGEQKLSPVPVYIKNKLFFTPYYIVDDSGRRLVRREVTDFFRSNYEAIYKKKADYYERLIAQTQDESFWLSRFSSRPAANLCATRCREVVADFTPRMLAEHYLSYYGVPWPYRFRGKPAAVWANRYDEFGSFIPPDSPNVNPFCHFALDDSVSRVLGVLKCARAKYYTKQDEIYDKVTDFWNSTSTA